MESSSGTDVGSSSETGEGDSTDLPEGGRANEFKLSKSDGGVPPPTSGTESKIKGTQTKAAMKFTVVDKEKGPIRGIVILMTAPDGTRYSTEPTNAEGYAEVLVPNGQKYELVYLALGRKDVASSVTVTDEPNQNIRLTLRYKRYDPPPRKVAPSGSPAPEPGFVLENVNFDSGKATIRPESFPQLDGVVEYMTYKPSSKIEISGHTDNVGNPKTNKALSEKRAQACRDYLISKGIDGSRVTAVGYGDQWPIETNDTEEGRQKNRRIEAVEQ
jgi:outer membrane protein OmpA-like peptidoglycan-associated protein